MQQYKLTEKPYSLIIGGKIKKKDNFPAVGKGRFTSIASPDNDIHFWHENYYCNHLKTICHC